MPSHRGVARSRNMGWIHVTVTDCYPIMGVMGGHPPPPAGPIQGQSVWMHRGSSATIRCMLLTCESSSKRDVTGAYPLPLCRKNSPLHLRKSQKQPSMAKVRWTGHLFSYPWQATTLQPGVLCGWSSRLEQSTTYIINVAQDLWSYLPPFRLSFGN